MDKAYASWLHSARLRFHPHWHEYDTFEWPIKGVSTVTRIMNVDQVARYLGVVPDTIYRKARRGEIPAVKMGKVWRFPKETLDKWLNDAALETVKKG